MAIHTFPWSAGFGTIVSVGQASINNRGVDWASDSAHLGVDWGVSPFVKVYPWTGAYGTAAPNPSPLPPGLCNSITWITM